MEAMNAISTRPRRLAISTARDGAGKMSVAVRDAGAGFDSSNASRLFEAFYSSKPHGTGMGLAICRSIIEAHGGEIWAANNTDYGATFQISLNLDSAN
jgi:signal transduction histidine kinase